MQSQALQATLFPKAALGASRCGWSVGALGTSTKIPGAGACGPETAALLPCNAHPIPRCTTELRGAKLRATPFLRPRIPPSASLHQGPQLPLQIQRTFASGGQRQILPAGMTWWGLGLLLLLPLLARLLGTPKLACTPPQVGRRPRRLAVSAPPPAPRLLLQPARMVFIPQSLGTPRCGCGAA